MWNRTSRWRYILPFEKKKTEIQRKIKFFKKVQRGNTPQPLTDALFANPSHPVWLYWDNKIFRKGIRKFSTTLKENLASQHLLELSLLLGVEGLKFGFFQFSPLLSISAFKNWFLLARFYKFGHSQTPRGDGRCSQQDRSRLSERLLFPYQRKREFADGYDFI